MSFFKDLSIGRRLALGFGTLILILLLMAGLGIRNSVSAKEQTGLLAANLHLKVTDAQSLAYAVMDSARVARNTLLLTDPAKIAPNRAAFEKNRARSSELLQELAKLSFTDESRRMVEKASELNRDYYAFTEEVVKLGEANEMDKGAALLFGPRYAVQGQYLKLLNEMVALYERQMTEAAAEVKADSEQTVLVTGVLVGLAVALGCLIGWGATRSITVPMAEAINAAEAVGRGDLSTPIPEGHQDETGRLLRALRAMQASLATVVSSVRQNAEGVATASAQIASGNADLSQRTEEQASALQQTAATMGQLGSTVQNNTSSAQQADQLAKSAAAVASQGGEVVGQVVSTMQGITGSSRKIGEIIGVIDGIAFQTNILALNAAVEAARAGEQGRGFAVVAGEVRTLAQRSAEAAREIKSLIQRNVEQVEQGSQLVDRAGQTMQEIVQSVQRVTSIVSDITAASVEQGHGIGQVSQAVAQMDQVTQQNAALVEESAAAAESLKAQSAQLVQLVAVFKVHGAPAASAPTLAPAVAVAARPAPAPVAQPRRPAAPAVPAKRAAAPAAAVAEDDWTSF
ncbi:MAG: methyl-accepting chemotaxis protein [Rubrivivax sp.]